MERLSRRSRSGLLLRVDTKHVSVGAARSEGSGRPLLCFPDRLEYKFVRRGATVDMVMYYADMCDVEVDEGTGVVSFHVVTPLEMFAPGYDPDDRSHRLAVQLATRAGMARLRGEVVPRVRGLATTWDARHRVKRARER